MIDQQKLRAFTQYLLSEFRVGPKLSAVIDAVGVLTGTVILTQTSTHAGIGIGLFFFLFGLYGWGLRLLDGLRRLAVIVLETIVDEGETDD